MTPEEASEFGKELNEAFVPFINALVRAADALARWARDNKELFEELERQLEANKGLRQLYLNPEWGPSNSS